MDNPKDWTPAEAEAARHLLWHYGQPGGYEPGSFHTALIRALEAADTFNKARLLGAFPEFRKAVYILETQGAQELSRLLTY